MGFCRKTSSGVQRGWDRHRNMDCAAGTPMEAVRGPSDGTPLLTQNSLPGYTSPATPLQPPVLAGGAGGEPGIARPSSRSRLNYSGLSSTENS